MNDVCRRAAEIIREKGWIQGKALGPNGENCLNEALMMAVVTGSNEHLASLDYLDARNLVLGRVQKERLADWNDEEGRTKEDVLELLDSLS